MLRAVFDWIARLLRSPREPYNARPDGLLRLDLASLRENLQPKEKGQAAGRANLPPSGALIPDARELEILRACQDAADKALKDTKGKCEALLMSIEQLSPSRQTTQINAVKSSVVSGFSTVLAKNVNEVRRQGQHCGELGAAFAAFRAQNRLSRPAVYPRSKTLLVGALFAMIVAEGAVNGVWFAEGSSQGLVGGVAQALVFAIVNIVLGFLAGRVPARYALHRSVSLRLLGVLGLLSYGAACLGLNLTIAHYRDLVVVGNQAGVDALESMLTHPLVLKDGLDPIRWTRSER